MKTFLIVVVVSTIFAQTPERAVSQVFPVDLEDLTKYKDRWLDPESMDGYNGAVYDIEEGEIVFKGHLRSGQLHGRYEEYHSRGFERGSYQEGKREGTFEVYSVKGKLSEKGIYQNGVRNGLYFAYHDNMRVWIKTEYAKGSWEGPYESFDATGNLISRGHYKANFQCGSWTQKGKVVEYPPCE